MPTPSAAPTSRRHPIANRALAYNHYGRAKWTLAQARLYYDIGQLEAAAFWVQAARESHRQARAYHRRLVAQGWELR